MAARQFAHVTASAVALLAITVSTIPNAFAQDATPVAQAVSPARPAHIHSGNCVELGDVVVPLTRTASILARDDEVFRTATTFTGSHDLRPNV